LGGWRLVLRSIALALLLALLLTAALLPLLSLANLALGNPEERGQPTKGSSGE
jgi:hypothetical protein